MACTKREHRVQQAAKSAALSLRANTGSWERSPSISSIGSWSAAVAVLCGSLRYGDLLVQSCMTYTDRVQMLPPRLLGSSDGCAALLETADAVMLPENYEKYCSARELEELRAYSEDYPLLRCAHQIDEGSLMYVEDKIERLRSGRKI